MNPEFMKMDDERFAAIEMRDAGNPACYNLASKWAIKYSAEFEVMGREEGFWDLDTPTPDLGDPEVA